MSARYNEDGTCSECYERPENCLGCQFQRCAICTQIFGASELYEHPGLYACETHVAEMQSKSETQKEQRDYLERASTERYRGLDFGDGPIGEANRRIFRR
jgi:hypothetical protein